MMNRGQSAAVMAHDAACVSLMRLWADDTPLPEHLEVWALDYLQRVEFTVTRRQDPAMVHTHPNIREFLATTTNALLLETYYRIEYKLGLVTCMMQEDGFGDEDAWAIQTFKDLNYYTTSLMGWVRLTTAYLEEPRGLESLDIKNLKSVYGCLAEGHASRLNIFLRDLRTQPVSCAALLEQATTKEPKALLPIEEFESLWGWHKGLLRLRAVVVVPA